ncbi:slipin family protein [Solwaraspora sp. WMMD1047]|uniref:slipin family protein n=1 Tax=Solwaraspora sp. WMMD1047 TaxID=3016102 RepID=UPI002416EA7A|nr:slipin family protein [Solwaraspora sp. WMMD1047]MDG4834586.1 slipin family protein [Solwaraspora sp. WMMD1047]
MAKTTVMDWERALLFTDGRYVRTLEPGRHRYWTFRDTVAKVDMRRRSTVVFGQELLTSDNVTLRVTVLVTWRVVDPLAFHTGSDDPGQALHLAAQLAIRDAVGGSTLDGLLADRRGLATGLAEATTAGVDGLGIEVLSAAVRDLMLPGELRRAVTETLLAKEAGRAELERARSEAAALRTLANAARVLEEHPALLKLRTLRAAEAPGTTVVLTHDPQHLP